MTAVAENLAAVRDQIAAAGGDVDRIAVVAVTKGFGPEAPRAALAAGLTMLGENYAQELLDKAEALDGGRNPGPVLPTTAQMATSATQNGRGGVEWHFIGRLQSNKVRMLADTVACWQSVDRESLVDEIATRAPGARIMVQVNATGEEHKGGCAVTDTRALVERARGAGLDVRGLMTVGVFDDEAATGRAFDAVRALVDDLGLAEASMGMSGDLALAVRAGTTMVRVGSALFGPRPAR